ncbi:protein DETOXIFICATION 16 [Canna indica]|uniref:Protein DETOXIFICATION n=1 Tax=Canna indica TaxID=4628 RepID=A0AAQ3QB02_9LILI|nr:protein DETOXIFICATION 16 [Canna indica]
MGTKVFVEMRKQLGLAGPLIASSILECSLQTISVIFVGHLGELSLSSSAMATAFAWVTGFSVMLGMAGGLDTLCGQAYGAGKYSMLSIHMQKAMVVLVVVCIPIAILWAFSGQILLGLGQDTEISVAAESYARMMIPSLFAFGLVQSHFRFLAAQNLVLPILLSAGSTSLLHLLLCWLLVYKTSLGNKGAALAISISHWFNLLLVLAYVRLSPACKETWIGFSKEGLHVHGVLEFIKLAIPSALMTCLETWSFDVLIILSGLLPDPKLETSVMTVSLNISSLTFMICYGFGTAISTRVSNELGANHPKDARLAVRVMLSLAAVEGLVVGLVLFSARNICGEAFSNEREIVESIAKMVPLLAFSHIMDGIRCVLSGAIRGCGKQKIGAIVNFVAYYFVGIPTSSLLALVFHFRWKGLWAGLMCAFLVQDLTYGIIILRTNWEKEALKASGTV